MSRMVGWYVAVAVVVLVGLTFWREDVSRAVSQVWSEAAGQTITPNQPSQTEQPLHSGTPSPSRKASLSRLLLSVREENNLVFAKPHGEVLALNVAIPLKGDGPFPAVVCLHGGGWVGGNRKQMAITLAVLARRGYVAIAPDYRLAPKHPFPACVEDAKTAVRWLRANAGSYRINPDRIGVVGLSAGGHIACMLGVTNPSDGLEGNGGNADRSSAVQAVVALSAPVDLSDETLWVEPTLSKNLMPLLGGSPREKLDLCRKASPLHYTPRRPAPTLLIHGSDDAVVPVRQAHALAERINHAGSKARVAVLNGEGHTFKGGALLQSIDKMLSFLDETLKK